MRTPGHPHPRPVRRRGRYGLAALLTLGLVATGSPAAAQDGDRDLGIGKVDATLRAQVQDPSGGAPVEVLVVLDSTPDLSRSAPRTDAVVATLRAYAEHSQQRVRETIARHGDAVTRGYWLKNMVLAEVDPDTVRALATLPEVDRIIPNFRLSVPEPPQRAAGPEAAGPPGPGSGAPGAVAAQGAGTAGPEAAAEAYTWGLEKIDADQVHQELGLRGAGVRVAVLDTGVDITHPDLAGKLATTDPDDPAYPGGWMEFDDSGTPVASQPHDSQTHGTHVAGTVVGGDASGTQIGVAPEAELMAALVLPDGEGTLAQVIAGMQWAADPYDAQGEPAGEPADVVNMSLGAVGHHAELIQPTRNLVAAGIFPSFAIGNNCFGGSSSPGNVYDAVGVGATDDADDVPAFSCGEVVHTSQWTDPPADWPDSYVVPDIAAPGVAVMSSYPGDRWRSASGTSMATPHVSGTVALMRQAAGGQLTVEHARQILVATAVGDGRYGDLPNVRIGHGRIDAYHAVLAAGYDSGVAGTVTDAATGEPVAGATVTRVDNGFAVRTGDDGAYQLSTPPGRYDIRVERFGYEPAEIPGVAVTDDTLTTVDVPLDPLPTHLVAGTVAVDGNGTAIPGATVRVIGAGGTLTATSGAGGHYLLRGVPEGTHQIEAYVPGLPPSPPVTVTVSGPVTDADLAVPQPGATELVSVGYGGTGADNYSIVPTVSQDGRYVVFRSLAGNLVPDDTNGSSDVFVRDLLTGHTERISVASDGTQSQGGGPFLLYPMMSDDARYVVWDDDAYNLVPGDTNQTYDVFVHDRRSRTTEIVSVASDGSYANDASLDPDISGDGRYIAFRSHATNLGVDPRGQGQVWVHDRHQGTTTLVSVGVDGSAGDGYSSRPSLSEDGRFVAFNSSATNLVPGDTNGETDIFVADRVAGTVERVSVASDGTAGNGDSGYPVISEDGRYVVFHSSADNLVPGDTNGRQDVFVHDRQTGETVRVSVASDGTQGNSSSHYPFINATGTHATFYSTADNLVPGDTNSESDVFVYDLTTGVMERVSVAEDGAEGTDYAQGASLSHDAGVATFHSAAPNLVWYDRNEQTDIFVRHRSLPDHRPRFVTWNLAAAPDEVAPGRTVLVRAMVTNIGDAAGGYRAQLRLDGVVVDGVDVTLAAGQSRQLTFRVRLTDQGPHELRLGAATTTVVVG